jgi:hypothetical protein
VSDTENPDLGLDHFEHDPEIAHTELPVAFQRLSQGLPIVMRCGLQPFFDGLTDSVLCFSVDQRQILNADSGMIVQCKGHESFPCILMRKRRSSIERFDSSVGKSCKRDICPQFNGLPDKVTGNGRQGNALRCCKLLHSTIQRRFDDNVYSRILGRHGSFSSGRRVALVAHRVKEKDLSLRHDAVQFFNEERVAFNRPLREEALEDGVRLT